MLLLCFVQCHRHSLSRTSNQLRLVKLRIPIAAVFHALIFLQKAHHYASELASSPIPDEVGKRILTGKGHLGDGKVLADADSRPAVKGHVLPRLGGPFLPSIGAEDGGVGKGIRNGRVEIRSALHSHGAVDDDVACRRCDFRLAFGRGKGRVLDYMTDGQCLFTSAYGVKHRTYCSRECYKGPRGTAAESR